MITLSFVFLAFISVSLLLREHSLRISTDMPFHFRRIIELKNSFMHYDLLPNFVFNEYNGSSIMLMYPYLNLYPVVLLSFIIKSKITLIYVYFMLNTFITFVISYYSCKSYIKNNSTSYVFAIIYGLSNMFLANYFLNMDLGIISSYMALPLIIFGFMNIIENRNNWLELSIGMIFVAFSHILNLVILTVFLIIWLFINFKIINKSLIIRLYKAIILFLVSTSVIYLQFLNFYFNNNDITMPPYVQLNRSGIKSFLEGIYGKVDVTNIGLFALVAMIISIFFYKYFSKLYKQLYFLSLGIVTLVLFFHKKITSIWLFKGLNQFQFTSRLFIIPHILLIFIFSVIITKYVQSYNKRKILYIITIILTILLQIIGQHNFIKGYVNRKTINVYDKNEMINYSSYKIDTSHQLMELINNPYDNDYNEYIPKKSLPVCKYVNNHNGIINNNKNIAVKNVGYNTFHFNGNKNIHKISLPIYMYNGEQVKFYLNNKLVNTFIDGNQLLSIDNTNNNINENTNTIYIESVLNKYKIISNILLYIGLLLLIILMIIKIFHLFRKIAINYNK